MPEPNHSRLVLSFIVLLCACSCVCFFLATRPGRGLENSCFAGFSEKDYEARTARAAKNNILHSFADGRQLGSTGRTPQVRLEKDREGGGGQNGRVPLVAGNI